MEDFFLVLISVLHKLPPTTSLQQTILTVCFTTRFPKITNSDRVLAKFFKKEKNGFLNLLLNF